jgi:type I restriction-modification system DNA methylase subunit/predicted type IV restriction endonuclease
LLLIIDIITKGDFILPEAPEIIKELVNKFERNQEAYKKSSYKEEQIKQEFINPFFKALGWDVDNEQGAAPQYRDVIFEDSIKVSGGTKAPDYCFTMAGRRMFFVEAKKPSVNIEKDIMPSYQLRRYAWSAKLPLSILTDFEEFAIYESRTRPKKSDRASTGRIFYFTYTDYVEKWDEIYNIFSKEAVLKGSFDKYAESTRKKRGTSSVDDEFLGEIEQWREILARNIALRNKELTIEDLNFAVQQIIDRIVFLRMCEDRGVEKYEQLRNLLDNGHIYENFCQLCKKADEKYNSGLFHFKEEKGRGSHPDELTLDLNIDDGVLKTIIKSLYYPNSPYEFSVLPAEILGNVYEQFLGKVIRLTPSHQAKVEEKPEVKKAGGVYYTPQFIVDYIVENTVGTLLKGKTPNKVSDIKILDPACGSGSFLLGAYNYLLKWHLNYYSGQDKKRLSDKLYKGRDDEYHLTIQEKKRILLNNIYGVDIDPQAVEVTKLSLLLKVLEGENKDALESQQKLFQERALPDLENNIKCGNSLIGPDIYELEWTSEDIGRINPFDWEEFPFEGFDAVIGNPPYLRIQGLQEYFGDQITYFTDNYQSAVKRFDIYLLFIEKGFNLLSKNGLLGYICPHKFLNSDFGSGIRQFLIDNNALNSFVSFGNNLVFKTASTYTGILLLSKDGKKSFKYYEFDYVDKIELNSELISLKNENFAKYNINEFNSGQWMLVSAPTKLVLDKLHKQPQNIGEVFNKVFQGVVTGLDEIYFLKRIKNAEESESIITVYSQREDQLIEIEKEILKPMLKGEDVSRYKEPDFNYYCIYPYKLVGDKTAILENDELAENFPLAYEYLSKYKKELKELRIKFKTNPKYWYSCHRGRSMALFESERIITPEISLGCNMTLAFPEIYHNTKVYSILPFSKSLENVNYWLGILNSRIMWYFLSNTGYVLRGGYFTFKTKYLKPFPIRTINFKNPEEVIIHDKMVKLVETMLQLNKDLQSAKIPNSKQNIQRQIEATDKQIDKLVYELYGLTEEEIEIIEDSS